MRDVFFDTSIPFRRRGDISSSLDRLLQRDAKIAKRERKEDDERDVFFLFEKRRASASTHTPEEALTKRRWSLFLPRLDIHIYTRTNVFGGGQK